MPLPQSMYSLDMLPYRVWDVTNPYPKFTLKSTKRVSLPYGRCLGTRFVDVPCCSEPYEPNNLLMGYLKRLSPSMPEIDLKEMAGLREFVKKWLERNMIPFVNMEKDYVSLFDKWLDDNTHYSGARKNDLRKKFLVMYEGGQVKLTSKDYVIKGFIKREFYENNKYVRFINSRMDMFKIRVGPFIHALEMKFFSENDYFVKHHNISELPTRINKMRYSKYILETDYTSFESAFNPIYVDAVECQLFRHMFKNNGNILHDVMKCYYQKDGKGIKPRVEKISNKYYRCKTQGTRMSGEMWTSLANTFSNLMNMLYLCDKYNITMTGMVEGDDGIFGLSDNTITALDFEKLGFKIKFKYAHRLRDTTFCGTLYDEQDLKLIITPELITRLGWTANPQYINCSKKKRLSLLLAKAQSLYCLGKHTPIASVLSLKIINTLNEKYPRLVAQYDEINRYWELWIHKMVDHNLFVPVEITLNARKLYADLFHITINQQLEIEKSIQCCEDITDSFFNVQLTDFANVESLALIETYAHMFPGSEI